MTNERPESLQLAAKLVALHGYPLSIKAANELRRIQSINDELLQSIRYIKVLNEITLIRETADRAIAKAEAK